MRGDKMTKLDLALRAIHLERELLKENVGVQDQLHAAYGGLNRFDFDGSSYRITPMMMSGECLEYLTKSMLLMHTGITRHASKVVTSQLERTTSGQVTGQLDRMLEQVDEAVSILSLRDSQAMLAELGRLLHDAWTIKRTLSPHVSSGAIDEMYATAMANGSLGGKLCGAGGGGFLLMVVPPEKQAAFIQSVAPARVINIGLDTQGSTIVCQ
jgi:D-glycero-alpha-D-manno-heptose-7-phosphate kinase